MIDVLGGLGVVLLLVAYFMVTTKRWPPVSWSYQLTNITAAVMLVIYSIDKSAHANVFLNLVFIAIGLVGIYSLLTQRPKPTNKRR